MGLSIFDLPREPYTVERHCPGCKMIRPLEVVPVFGMYGAVKTQNYVCTSCGKTFKEIVSVKLVEDSERED